MTLTYTKDDRVKRDTTLHVFPTPLQPIALKRKGGTNNNSHIMIAMMSINDATLKDQGYQFIFGNDSEELSGTINQRYYQYNDVKQFKNEKNWVKTQWKIADYQGTRPLESAKTELSTSSSIKQTIALTRGHLTAHVDEPTEAKVTVVAITGQKHRALQYEARTDFDEQIDLHALPAGVYVIKVTIGDQQTEEKIIVK